MTLASVASVSVSGPSWSGDFLRTLQAPASDVGRVGGDTWLRVEPGRATAPRADEIVVNDVMFGVDDVAVAHGAAVRAGAADLAPPHWGVLSTPAGERPVRMARVGGIGHVTHTFVEREPAAGDAAFDETQGLDHLALCLPCGTMGATVARYEAGFGLHVTQTEHIQTRSLGMINTVLQNASGSVKLVLSAPTASSQTTQLHRFVDVHGGAGIQHVALRVPALLAHSLALKRHEVNFAGSMPEVFDAMLARIGHCPVPRDAALALGIMADRDADGLLLQSFLAPSRTAEPVFFFELIERQGARGFGAANIRALFEAVERVQGAAAAVGEPQGQPATV
ncbi:VOC family protein [Ralstonia sp.]|uniref:VOC family protein n=1 Tax=Ralstonia sp. TaxID=54061 RepID=UPI0031CFC837